MSSEGKAREGREAKSRPSASEVVVFVVFAANATTAFTIQAWMTFGFGAKVWKMPDPLCVSLVVALDVFAVMFMVLTYLLRGTGWPRGAAMLVFLFAVGAQVFAAEQFGQHEQWPVSVRWFSALPAVLLALAQEGVILWRTHRNDRKADGPDEQLVKPVEQRPAPVRAAHPGAAPVVARPERPVKAPAAPPTSSGKAPKTGPRGRHTDPSEQERRDLIAASVIDGTDKKDAARSAGVSVRSVENWIVSYRDRHPTTTDQPADQQERPQLVEEVTA